MKPLHGEKTRSLSTHALEELRNIAEAPLPRCTVNPGVANRLTRENLVQGIQMGSPFPTHKGANIEHLEITDAGRERLAQEWRR